MSTCEITPKLFKTLRKTCFHTKYMKSVSSNSTRVLILTTDKFEIEEDMFTSIEKIHHKR